MTPVTLLGVKAIHTAIAHHSRIRYRVASSSRHSAARKNSSGQISTSRVAPGSVHDAEP